MQIRKLSINEEPPMELLLLADPSSDLVKDYVKRGECFVAEKEQEMIGSYVLLPTRPETVELVNIAVAESKQGNGIGKLLVLDAIKRAKEQGYKTMEVGTGNSSVGQLALYQKCNFRIVGVDRDFFTRHYVDKIFENDIWCRDMIRLSQDLLSKE
ncbi:GNAT family N-acetyltransferase [Robertmurraya massiliosenegalensis]|uniref:GNAT family N-acetyltransferase n=1 Tax=Robertmurraya massiliosenegalensis TaxID=1287657 RepID=UPI00031D1186|nr:GNAT family N-acetyltransferase [Robertmurraya massiliosenegalensis]